MLKRSPVFLRVVEEFGNFDALDQLEDEPKDTEKIYAYRVFGSVGACHINRAGGRGGFYTMADYKFIPQQPSDAVMRNDSMWGDWCKENV